MTRWLVCGMLGLVAVSCRDPVHDDAVDALGPEAPDVEQGPLHRPGQPCTACHGGDGPGGPTFDLAGTVYAFPGAPNPLPGGIVRVVDGSGRSSAVQTNEVGTFYWLEGQLDLEFPIWASVEFCGRVVEMKTPIFRERSCANCHSGPGPSSVEHVYFAESPEKVCQ